MLLTWFWRVIKCNVVLFLHDKHLATNMMMIKDTARQGDVIIYYVGSHKVLSVTIGQSNGHA